MKILVPVHTQLTVDEETSPPTEGMTLSGKTVGMLSNGWRSFDIMMERFEEIAITRYGAKKVVKSMHPEDASPAPDYAIEKILESDLVISGLGF